MKKTIYPATTIQIGAGFEVDAVEYASRANAILGIRDSGKTYTATMIAEQLFECAIPFFAFDPIGRWRFLRSPGKNGTGFPIVVAGGAAPDLPLTPEDAPKLVRAAMQSGVSMVIDLYSIGLSKKDWRAIVRASIETILYEGDQRGLRHVFLEEAAEFIPQHVRDGRTYAAVEKLARMGGNVGVGLTLINQRAEEVNKAVLELCDNLLLHRQRGKNSLLSLRKWLAAGNVDPPREITDSLADLPTGQCWGWFKDVGKPRLVHVAKKRSFDPNRRTMSVGLSATPRAIDVSAFVSQMKAALAGKPPPAKPASTATAIPAPQPKQEAEVNEKEARELRAANARLTEENGDLQRQLAELRARLDSESPPAAALNGSPVDIDAIYAEVVRRARKDPVVLKLLTSRPEIEVHVERKIVTMTEKTLPGRLAKMIATGFYDEPKTNSATRTELKRTGPEPNFGNLSRTLKEFVADGFLTAEGEGFQVVEGMKVNVVQQ